MKSSLNCYANAFCATLYRVTNYALVIEECFSRNQYVSRMNGYDFAWYSKCGGENSGLDVTISIKNEHGVIINSTQNLQLITELVYSDGSPTPFMPLSPLKERKKTCLSNKPLYRPLRPEPVLGPNLALVPFCFRIEEVSFHHTGHTGFKLKVSSSRNSPMMVHPGVLTENIIVLSKPKQDAKSGISCYPMTPITSSSRNFPALQNCFIDNESNAFIAIDTLISGLRNKDGHCICCCKKILDDFFETRFHAESCHLVTNLFPFIKKTEIDLQAKTQKKKKRHQGRKIRTSTTITPSKRTFEDIDMKVKVVKSTPKPTKFCGNNVKTEDITENSSSIATTPKTSNLNSDDPKFKSMGSPIQNGEARFRCTKIPITETFKVSPIRSGKMYQNSVSNRRHEDGSNRHELLYESYSRWGTSTPWPKRIKVEHGASSIRALPSLHGNKSTFGVGNNKNLDFANMFEGSTVSSKLSPQESIGSISLNLAKSVTFDENIASTALSLDSDIRFELPRKNASSSTSSNHWPKEIKEENSSLVSSKDTTPPPNKSTLKIISHKNLDFGNMFDGSTVSSKLSPQESICSMSLNLTKSVTFEKNLVSEGLSLDADVSPLFGRTSVGKER